MPRALDLAHTRLPVPQNGIIELNMDTAGANQAAPRALKTFTGKFYKLLNEWIPNPVLNLEFVKPRFALYKMKAALAEIKYLAEGEKIDVDELGAAISRFDSSGIKAPDLQSALDQEMGVLIEGMSPDRQNALFTEITKIARPSNTAKAVASLNYCKILQRRIIRASVGKMREEFDALYFDAIQKGKSGDERQDKRRAKGNGADFGSCMDRISKKISDARNKFAAPGLDHIDSEISRASLPSQRWFNEKLRRMSLGEKLNLLIKLRDRRQATDADPEENARLDAFYTLVDRVRDFSTAELLAKDKAGLLKTARAN
jgi:hypothetical protein